MVDELSQDAFARLLDDEDADVTVIDVREPVEYALGHISGAENAPMGNLAEQLPRCDLSVDVIVVVCPVGELSVQAGRLIEAFEGVDEKTVVASLDGGYAEWSGDLEPTDQNDE